MKASSTAFLIFVLGAIEISCLQMCGAQTQYQVAANESVHTVDEVSIAVKSWQDATDIRVTDEALQAIQQGFGTEQVRLKRYFAKQELEAKREPEFIDSVLYQYLYDLRDRKLLPSIGNATAAASANSFRLFQEVGGTPIIIGRPDVDDFPPLSFFEKIQRVLDNKVGHLDVLSEPDLATITIDHEKKNELSCRTFVVSPGDHTVAVLKPKSRVNCSEKVTVAADATEQVTCPKKAAMKCRLPSK